METTTPNIPAAPAAPAPAMPAAEPVTAAPAPAIPMPAPGQPGAVTAQRGALLAGVTLMDVGMITLFTVAMLVGMYSSYQQLMFVRKQGLAERAEIDEIKANLQAALGDKYEPQE
jgi:hypothetical protein